jgi:ATP-dependent Clp protease ATP-binding subunit ClpA
MEPFDKNGYVDQARFEADAFQVLIKATQLAVAPATRSLRCKTGHVLLALWPTLGGAPGWRDTIEAVVAEGCSLSEIPGAIEAYVSDSQHEQVFQMKEEDFDPAVAAALKKCDLVEDGSGQAIWQAGEKPVGILPLWVAILSRATEEDRQGVGALLNFEAAAERMAGLLAREGKPPEEVKPPDLYSPDGALQLERFDDAAVSVLETAKERAGGLGYDHLRPPHLFVALLERPDGITEEVVRLQARPGTGPKTVCEAVIRAITLGPRVRARPLGLDRRCLSESFQAVLEMAATLAVQNGAETVGERFLLRAVLEHEREGVVGRVLGSDEFKINSEAMIRDVDKRIRDYRLGRSGEEVTPFLIPGDVARSEDFTYLARTGQLRPTVGQDGLIQAVLRGLHKRQNNHILISGEAGVGKTELVRELARRAATGEVPFLKRKKIVWVDCDGVPPDQSRSRFDDIVAAVKGRNDVTVCLDHFENIVRYCGGAESHNRAILRVALRNRDLHLIAIIETRHLVELLSHDYALLEMFNRVDVPEVAPKEAIEIITGASVPSLERLYGLAIEEGAVKRAAHASREFIMSERLPTKAIKVLRDACERVSYDKDEKKIVVAKVKDADVVWAISQRTGIDEGTIAGSGSKEAFAGFATALACQVAGQQNAVDTVVARLQKIKAGATREGKPAAVFLFAGLTGTGKTELAKAVARVYSASGRLSVYPMTNYSEEHSISGITGVPPGYVGYDSGGRLINDLNADPYGVILFDEAEKAHPNVWQSMLSLFDEAWIEDRRNVKAYGNRAIFILTSNAGQEVIRQHYKSMPLDKLKEEVAKGLVEYVNPNTGKHPFSPEFLGRFTDIIIFNPLSQEAMENITRIQVGQLAQEWKTKRETSLVVDEAVIRHVAALSYQENERHGGTRGGRVVAKHVGNLIELKLINFMVNEPEGFRDAEALQVLCDPAGDTTVRVVKATAMRPSEALNRVEERLGAVRPPKLDQIAGDVGREVEAAVEGWGRHVAQALPAAEIEKVRQAASAARQAIVEKAAEFNRTIERQRDAVLGALHEASPGAGEPGRAAE